MAGQDWSDEENDALVATYFAMLAHDLRGDEFEKAQMIRDVRSALSDRSEKSVEYKLRNVSAVLYSMRIQPVPGLKLLSNFQSSLIDAVHRFFVDHPNWILDSAQSKRSIERFKARESPAFSYGAAPHLRNALPEEDEIQKDRDRVARKIDLGALDASNRALGRAGEEFAVEFERSTLNASGRYDLAKRVDWVSQSKGDGLGYDIQSFEPNGKERLIEVKTTNGDARTPFHITRNELAVADEFRDRWVLARLYNFAREPNGFELRPPLQDHVALTPTTFLASLN